MIEEEQIKNKKKEEIKRQVEGLGNFMEKQIAEDEEGEESPTNNGSLNSLKSRGKQWKFIFERKMTKEIEEPVVKEPVLRTDKRNMSESPSARNTLNYFIE